jgi:Tfp pilus assembly protein PilO
MDIQFSKPTLKDSFSTKLQNQSKNKYSWFEVVLLVVAIILVYMFLVRSKQTSLTEAQERLGELQKQSTELESNITKLNKLVVELDVHKQDLLNLDEALPLQAKTIRLRMLLQDTVASSGMTLASLSIGAGGNPIVAGNKEVLANPYIGEHSLKKLDANVSVTGSLEQFQDLMNKIETTARLLDVTGFNVGASKDNLLQFNIILSSYYYGA